MKTKLVLLSLLLVLAVTGVEVGDTAHGVRRLHTEMEDLRQRHDQALMLHSQLLLEIGAVASLSQVQQFAQNELQMQFPERLEQIRE
ncbi:MAG: cell division protein FtsL [Pseudomonadales bacterium]